MGTPALVWVDGRTEAGTGMGPTLPVSAASVRPTRTAEGRQARVGSADERSLQNGSQAGARPRLSVKDRNVRARVSPQSSVPQPAYAPSSADPRALKDERRGRRGVRT